eukprot:399992-Amphidinium_carterae.1
MLLILPSYGSEISSKGLKESDQSLRGAPVTEDDGVLCEVGLPTVVADQQTQLDNEISWRVFMGLVSTMIPMLLGTGRGFRSHWWPMRCR